MPDLRKRPYIIGGILAILILFLPGIFALEASFTESLPGSAVISVVAAAGYWWMEEIKTESLTQILQIPLKFGNSIQGEFTWIGSPTPKHGSH